MNAGGSAGQGPQPQGGGGGFPHGGAGGFPQNWGFPWYPRRNPNWWNNVMDNHWDTDKLANFLTVEKLAGKNYVKNTGIKFARGYRSGRGGYRAEMSRIAIYLNDNYPGLFDPAIDRPGDNALTYTFIHRIRCLRKNVPGSF